MSFRNVLVIGFPQGELHGARQIERIGRELLDAVQEATHKRLLLNLADVTSMSSAMVTKFVMLNKECRAQGVRLQLCNLSPSVWELFEITKLNKLFEIIHHVDDDPDDPDPIGCRLYIPPESTDDSVTVKRIQAMRDIMENEG